MDAMDRFGQELIRAARRRDARRRLLPRRFGAMLTGAAPRRGVSARLRVVLVVLALVLATSAITLAATGVILTGSPVGTVHVPVATVGEGIPVSGGTRLLSLRAPDPAGGLPWGMRIIHTTRGLICVQIGRVLHGQLGQLGVDGAFHNDGRFHPLPPDALPDVLARDTGWMAGNCSSVGDTYSGDSVGLGLSAVASRHPAAAPEADLREISFGLLGVHAVAITYREGSQTRTRPVSPGTGAYLIAQRYSSGRPLGSVSESAGRDEPGNYSQPVSPNGALTAITYSYAGRTCVDTGNLRDASCGLSEVPRKQPVALPVVHTQLHARLQIHHHEITSAQITFHAPYPVTTAGERYSVTAPTCHNSISGGGSDEDLAAGASVAIPVGDVLSAACARTVTFTVEYVRSDGGLAQGTPLGSITIHEPRGTHPKPLPRDVIERERRMNPTRSLHARIHLALLPQPLAACNAAFLLHPCYKSQITFTAPYAATPPATEYSVEAYASCKAGGRPDATQTISRAVRAHETLTTTSLGLFVLTPSCTPKEGYRVAYLNQQAPSAGEPNESVIVGTAPMSRATQLIGHLRTSPASGVAVPRAP